MRPPEAGCSANFSDVVVPMRSIQLRSTPRLYLESCGSLLLAPAGDSTR